jgi:plexin A
MRDLTADLGASAIPTLDHRSYVMKVFFPGVTEHPILKDPKVKIEHSKNAYAVVTAFLVVGCGLK